MSVHVRRSPASRRSNAHRSRLYVQSALFKICFLTALSPFLLWRSDSFGGTSDTTFITEVEAALAKLDATDLDDDWYFSMEVVDEGELRIVRSDPHRDKYERRQLLSVNGVAPDTQRQQKFRETEVKRIDELDPDAVGYRYLVDSATLRLMERGDGYAKLSFVPRITALEKSRDQLRGAVLLNLATQQIEEIEIHNTGKLSPAFSVTVDTYQLTLKFQQEQGENILKKLESHAVGKAGFLKSFDVLVDVTFSDYRRAEP